MITDANGQVLFIIRNKLIAIHKTFVGEDANENEIFRITKKMAIGTKMQAKFKDHMTGRDTVIELRGDFWGGSGDLKVENGPVVAQISRQVMNMREVFTDNQTVSLYGSEFMTIWGELTSIVLHNNRSWC